MSYRVRNPYEAALREHQREDELEEDTLNYKVIAGNTQKRLTNTNSGDTKYRPENENDTTSSVIFEEAVNVPDPNHPIVTYSTRKPNYPTGYSCEHSLLYSRNGPVLYIENAVEMLSHSEDVSNDEYSISLNTIPVQLSLEFKIPIGGSDEYDETISNVEALQWSLLNKIAASSGLSVGCKIENQYDERTLVTAFTNINEMDESFTDEGETSNDSSVSRNKRHSNSQKKNRRRTREMRSNRILLSTLPYPTSIYSIASTRPKWTASCSTEKLEDKESASKCFTAEINFDVKYRGTTGESNLIEEYVQSVIHNQIALDPTKLFAENITGLKWISNDEASSIFDQSDSDQGSATPIFFGPGFSLEGDNDGVGVDVISTPSKEESDNLFASLIIPFGTVVFLGAIWCCFHKYYIKKRRSRKILNQKKAEGPAGAQEQNDIETGSDGTIDTRDFQSKSSSETQDSQEVKSGTEAMAKAIGTSGSDGTIDTRDFQSKSSSETQNSQEVKSCTEAMAKAIGLSPAASSTLQQGASDSTLSADSPERSTAGLPPRPLTTKRAVSTQLKKKRRKKKRKKKQVLSMTRTNSRDNIVEMPMISESESECDSEYTSGDEEDCDDGSSIDASSVCSTPGRSSTSRSRASSRASSPQKSPRDDLFPPGSAGAPSFEFDMEAPEFSWDLFMAKALKPLKPVIGVDENMSPNVALRPRMRPEQDDSKPHSVQVTIPKKEAPLAETKAECCALEIDNSFTEENGTVMERMLPLPWLAKKTIKKKFNL